MKEIRKSYIQQKNAKRTFTVNNNNEVVNSNLPSKSKRIIKLIIESVVDIKKLSSYERKIITALNVQVTRKKNKVTIESRNKISIYFLLRFVIKVIRRETNKSKRIYKGFDCFKTLRPVLFRKDEIVSEGFEDVQIKKLLEKIFEERYSYERELCQSLNITFTFKEKNRHLFVYFKSTNDRTLEENLETYFEKNVA